MEVTTTMVRFTFPKAKMTIKTDKAQLFLCDDGIRKTRIWMPLSKFETFDYDNKVCEIVMAKWLFMKSDLPIYVQPEEFIITHAFTAADIEEFI